MTEAERERSVNRSPSSDWLPWDSLRWMTGPRRARSAALLVLSRYRDNDNYADVPVMPMLAWKTAGGVVIASGSSA